MLWFITQTPLLDPPAEARAPVVSEWVDPRYESLAKAWVLAQPPPGVAGFVDPHP